MDVQDLVNVTPFFTAKAVNSAFSTEDKLEKHIIIGIYLSLYSENAPNFISLSSDKIIEPFILSEFTEVPNFESRSFNITCGL